MFLKGRIIFIRNCESIARKTRKATSLNLGNKRMVVVASKELMDNKTIFNVNMLSRYFLVFALSLAISLIINVEIPKSENIIKRLTYANAKEYFPMPTSPKYLAIITTKTKESALSIIPEMNKNPVFLAIVFADDIYCYYFLFIYK